jgi:cytochrome c oxidase subunit 4
MSDEETGPLAQQAAAEAAAATAVVDAPAPPVGQGTDPHGAHSHGLSDAGYVRVFFGLIVLTGLEVAWSYVHSLSDATGGKHLFWVLVFIVMMSIKFVVVASNFMHLKFDDKLLTRLFYAGLITAVIVYVIALTTFHVFW